MLEIQFFPVILFHDLDESLEKIANLLASSIFMHDAVGQLAANDLVENGRVNVIQYFSNSSRPVQPWLAHTVGKVQRECGIHGESSILFKELAKEVVPSWIASKGLDVTRHASHMIGRGKT
jgi:hypothetical protein